MAEVTDVTADIELNAGQQETFGEWAKGVAGKVPIAEQAITGYETVTNLWQGLPEDPDAGDLLQHAGDVVSDATGFVTECAVEAGEIALDPVGWLIEKGLGIVLHLVTPLQDALHQVTGDGPGLSDASDDFNAIGEGLLEYAQEFTSVADDALNDWSGQASDAARHALADFAKGIEGVATSAGSVAQILKASSMIMTVVEEVIKSIITEFVSWLIWIWVPALAGAVFSFGASTAAAMSASLAKAASVTSKVTSKLGKLGKLLDKVLDFFKRFGSKMADLGKRLGAQPNNYRAFGDEVGQVVSEVGRGGAMRTAVTESLKKGGATAVEQTLGFNPTSAQANAMESGTAVMDQLDTLQGHADDIQDYADKGDLGSGDSAARTRDYLDI